ncbi:hypothetical protein CR513_35675, partial [Mucuna pruriens]
MAPDRSRLQNMVKKEQEGFKEYAWRWRELAAQVQPALKQEVVITAAKVLITNGFEPGKGLGRRLDGMANLVAIQENPG